MSPGPVALPAVVLAQMQGWAGARAAHGRNLSTALRESGLTRDPWPDTVTTWAGGTGRQRGYRGVQGGKGRGYPHQLHTCRSADSDRVTRNMAE